MITKVLIPIIFSTMLLCPNAFAKPENAPPDVDVNVVNTPDVNVVNTPDVNVVNDAANPVPVTVTNAPTSANPNIPFTVYEWCNPVGNICKVEFDSLDVYPEGGYNMIVIQQVSFRIKSDVIDGQAFSVYMIGTYEGEQWLQQLVTTGGITSGGFQIAGESINVTAYHDDLDNGSGLQALRVSTELNGDNGVASQGFASVSGYYTIKAE